MSLLDFYLEQQKYPEWYQKFQSMAKDKSGKVFSYSSTTYRYIHNFVSDVEKFYRLNGIPMKDWSKYENGQKEDKQRPLPLTLANFVVKKEDRYFFTSAGYTCLDIVNSHLYGDEEWILLFLLLLDYRSEWRNNDIILTSQDYFKYLTDSGLEEKKILSMLLDLQSYDNIDDIMQTDIFWLVTFAKDRQFIDKYLSSSEEDKRKLQEYVINEKNNKKSKDCIGHKYVNSGQMLPKQFLEECKMLYVAYKIAINKYANFNDLLLRLYDVYGEFGYSVDYSKINDFVDAHLSIYEDIFNRSGLRSDDSNE